MPVSAMKKSFDILGLALGASEAEIKAAYRKAALQNHPDKLRAGTPEDPSAKPASYYDAATGFDSTRPPQPKPPRKPRRTYSFHSDDPRSFFSDNFNFDFQDLSASGEFNFNFVGANRRPKPPKGRAKAREERERHAAEAEHARQKREKEEAQTREDRIQELSDIRKAEVDAKRAPEGERFDFYQEATSQMTSKGPGQYYASSSYPQVCKQLDRLHWLNMQVIGTLGSLLKWLDETVRFKHSAPRFIEVQSAANDATRVSTRYWKLRKEADKVEAQGWDSNPEVARCLLAETYALMKYLRPVEHDLSGVVADFTVITKSQLERFNMFNSDKRQILWAAIKGYRTSIQHLDSFVGARFIHGEYLGR